MIHELTASDDANLVLKKERGFIGNQLGEPKVKKEDALRTWGPPENVRHEGQAESVEVSSRASLVRVTTDKRYPLLPDVPTTSEAGFPGIEVTSWNGLMVPSGTSRDIVSKISAEVARIAGAPEMRARIIELGFQPVAMSVSDTENLIRVDVERWAKVIRDTGIKAD
jgi:tripartite-type tricarboxylate transporter receptor subunit TctC